MYWNDDYMMLFKDKKIDMTKSDTILKNNEISWFLY